MNLCASQVLLTPQRIFAERRVLKEALIQGDTPSKKWGKPRRRVLKETEGTLVWQTHEFEPDRVHQADHRRPCPLLVLLPASRSGQAGKTVK